MSPRDIRRVLAPLAALCLLFAGLLPQGWMPRAGAEGVSVVLCTSEGRVAAVLDPGTDAPEDEERPRPCAYAGACPECPQPGPADVGGPPARPAAAPAGIRPRLAPPGPALRLPPAQAPPASA